MSLSALLPLLSIVALIISFLMILAKRETDTGRWRKIVFLGMLLLSVNVAVEIGKRLTERRREEAAKQREAEQRAVNLQLILDVQSLNRVAAEAFEKLERTVKSLPVSTGATVSEAARRVHDQLNKVTQASARGNANVAQLKSLIEETQAGIHSLNISIVAIERMKQQKQQTRIDQRHLLGETPDRLTEIPSAQRTTSVRQETSSGPSTSVGGAPRFGNSTSTSTWFLASITGAAAADTSVVPLLIEDDGFVPTAFGDGSVKGSVEVDGRSAEKPYSPPYCQRLTYIPMSVGHGWAAIAWQFPKNNWGDMPGKDWSNRRFKQVTVWARGVRQYGKLPKVQFKAGSTSKLSKKYPASFEVAGAFVTLSEEWKQYSLDLSGKNLSQVMVALVMVFSPQDADSQRPTTVYVDDIEYR